MEREEAWEPTTRIPVVDEDILEVGYCQNRTEQKRLHLLVLCQAAQREAWQHTRLPKE